MPINGKTFKPVQEGGAKIIAFPKNRITRFAPLANEEPEIIAEARKLAAQNFADDITTNIIRKVVGEYRVAGLNLDRDPEQYNKDLSFAVESVRAMTYRLLGLKHHLHSFLEANIKLAEQEEMDMESENDEVIENLMEENDISFSPDFDIEPDDDGPEVA